MPSPTFSCGSADLRSPLPMVRLAGPESLTRVTARVDCVGLTGSFVNGHGEADAIAPRLSCRLEREFGDVLGLRRRSTVRASATTGSSRWSSAGYGLTGTDDADPASNAAHRTNVPSFPTRLELQVTSGEWPVRLPAQNSPEH